MWRAQIVTGAAAAQRCDQLQASRQKYPPTAPSAPSAAELWSLLQSSPTDAGMSPSWAAVSLNDASWLHACEWQSGLRRSGCNSTNRFPPYDCCPALMQQRQQMTVETEIFGFLLCIEFVSTDYTMLEWVLFHTLAFAWGFLLLLYFWNIKDQPECYLSPFFYISCSASFVGQKVVSPVSTH